MIVFVMSKAAPCNACRQESQLCQPVIIGPQRSCPALFASMCGQLERGCCPIHQPSDVPLSKALAVMVSCHCVNLW